MSSPRHPHDMSMLELFRVESESQCAILTAGLLEVEQGAEGMGRLDELMRAAHSLKGAARIIGLDVGVRVAHALEEAFVAAQKGQVTFEREHIDLLFWGVDLLTRLAETPENELSKWNDPAGGGTDPFLAQMKGMLAGRRPGSAIEDPPVAREGETARRVSSIPTSSTDLLLSSHSRVAAGPDRFLRLTANQLNRLLGLTGESLVTSRQLNPFAQSLRQLKRMQAEVGRALDGLRDTLTGCGADEPVRVHLAAAQGRLADCREFLGERLVVLENFDRHSANLATRLHDEAVACRMRPFADGVQGFARMVRDLARRLGKEAAFEIVGENTPVDRDMLERLEAPLTHLLRNAVDHGLESPAQRQAAGKPAVGRIRVEARHSAGMLFINISDDGRGISRAALREAILRTQLASAEAVAKLSEVELLEFLFLPGFSMKETVTEISGRGVGLDVVRNMVKEVRGTLRIFTEAGQGTRFQLQLPLTLSVVRTLLVEIAGEPYAFPLANICRTVKVPPRRVQTIEGRQQFEQEGRQIGLVAGRQLLGHGELKSTGDEWPVVLLGDDDQLYGLVVDGFLGEGELIVQPLDARLGKIKDISAGALMEDGTPVLLVDTEDLLRSIEKIAAAGELQPIADGRGGQGRRRKRVLVVEDSLNDEGLLDAVRDLIGGAES